MASLIKAMNKGVEKGKIESGFKLPWMQDDENIKLKHEQPAGEQDTGDDNATAGEQDTGDDIAPAGEQDTGGMALAGKTDIEPSNNRYPIGSRLHDSSIIRKKAVAEMKRWIKSSGKNKEFKRLKQKEFAFEFLIELYGSRKEVLVRLFRSLKSDQMTPRLSPDEGAVLTNQKKSTFLRTIHRLDREFVIARYGFKTRTGGAIYWVHPTVLDTLKELEKSDPSYFDF